MQRRTALLIIGALLVLPVNSFAQLDLSASQGNSQQTEICQPSKVHVQIKLKNGDTINGDSIEINTHEVKLCRDGLVQTIPGDQIKAIKSRQTARQRFRHAARVLGITWAISLAVAFIRFASEK